jgi:hypothetical protein
MRVFVALGLSLYVALAWAVPSTAWQGVCVEACEDDGPDGGCAPDCVDCCDCGHRPVSSTCLTVTVSVVALLTDQAPSQPAPPPAAPEPDDILHVPKPLT